MSHGHPTQVSKPFRLKCAHWYLRETPMKPTCFSWSDTMSGATLLSVAIRFVPLFCWCAVDFTSNASPLCHSGMVPACAGGRFNPTASCGLSTHPLKQASLLLAYRVYYTKSIATVASKRQTRIIPVSKRWSERSYENPSNSTIVTPVTVFTHKKTPCDQGQYPNPLCHTGFHFAVRNALTRRFTVAESTAASRRTAPAWR
jgi:hypothetical protein